MPYLEKARSLGFTDASYALGIACLIKGDKDKAIASLMEYKRLRPNDGEVDALIDTIRNGKIELHKR